MTGSAATPSARPSTGEQDLNPYVGPRPLRPSDTLYGRQREVTDLSELLIAQRIVLLYSPSGAGKTSLVQAGLLPRMAEEGFRVLPVARVNRLAEEDTPVHNRYVASVLSCLEDAAADADASAAAVETGEAQPLSDATTLAAGFAALGLPDPSAAASGDSFQPILLILDQFEEILTLDPTDVEAKRRFFEELGALLRDNRYWVLFSLREDHLAGLDPFRFLVPTRLNHRFRLEFLDETAAIQAIRGPAAERGVEFTRQAAVALVHNLRQQRIQRPDGALTEQLGPYVEPVQLQVVCRRLWDRLIPGAAQILPEQIETTGDVDSALAEYYAGQVQQAAQQTGVGERQVRAWIQQHLLTAQGVRSQVLRGAQESDGLDNQVIDRLVSAHLLRGEQQRGATWIELAHDRLIGPIQADNARWIEEHLSLLQKQAVLWDDQGRQDGLLLTGDALAQADAWAAAHPNELSAVDQAFLDAGVTAHAAAVRERRRTRTIQWLGIAAMVLAAVTFALGVVAWQQSRIARSEARRAEQEADLALSRQLAAQAQLNLDQPDLALLLARQAYAITRTVEAEGSLLQSLQAAPQLLTYLRGAPAPVYALAWVDDQRMISADGGGAVTLWELDADPRVMTSTLAAGLGPVRAMALADVGATVVVGDADGRLTLLTGSPGQEPLRQLAGGVDQINALALRPDGALLAVADAGGTIRFWRTADWSLCDECTLQVADGDGVASMAYSQDGSRLAAGLDGGDIVLYDGAGGLPARLRHHADRVNSLAFSPDGAHLVSGSSDETAAWWSLAELQPSQVMTHTGQVRSILFADGGRRLATAARDGRITLWNVDDGLRKLRDLDTHAAGVLSLALAPDGHTLVSGDEGGQILLWDLHDDLRIGRPWPAEADAEVWSTALSPDASSVAAGRDDGAVLVWDPQDGAVVELGRHAQEVRATAFDPAGRWLATGGHDGQVRLWELAVRPDDGRPAASTVLTHSAKHWVTGVGFSPDGSVLASTSFDPAKPIILWDLTSDPPSPKVMAGHAGQVWSLAFAPSGDLLATVDDAGAVRLWNWRTGAATAELAPEAAPVIDVAASPDGRRLALATGYGVVVWDLETQSRAEFSGHEQLVTSVVFLSDGLRLASADSGGRIALWDLVSGRPIGRLQGHGSAVNTVRASQEGSHMLVSAGADGAVILWNLDVAGWLELACRVAGRDLTREEWTQYLGSNRPYDPACGAAP